MVARNFHRLVAAISAGSGGGAPSVVTNGVLVANRLQIPTSQQSGVTNFCCQRQHTATSQGAISNLVFTDIHWTIDPSFLISALATTYTFTKFVEYPQGTFTPVLYSGGTTGTLNSSTRTVTSDVLAISIPAGATFWEHTINLTGITVAHIELPVAATTLGLTDAKYTATGGVPVHQSTGQASTFFFGSVLITGTVTGSAAAKSVVIFGDSIPWGAGDITGVGGLASSGPFARCLDLTGIPHFKFAVSSMRAQHLATIISAASPTYAPLQALMNSAATHAFIEYGANDLSLGSRTQAQLLADYSTIQAALTSPKWGLCTITARSTSTDSYATTVNQTAKTDGTWPLLTSVNTAIRAVPAGFTYVIDYADDVMTARDSGIWKVPGFAPTTDGTHPTTQMALYLAANLTIPLP